MDQPIRVLSVQKKQYKDCYTSTNHTKRQSLNSTTIIQCTPIRIEQERSHNATTIVSMLRKNMNMSLISSNKKRLSLLHKRASEAECATVPFFRYSIRNSSTRCASSSRKLNTHQHSKSFSRPRTCVSHSDNKSIPMKTQYRFDDIRYLLTNVSVWQCKKRKQKSLFTNKILAEMPTTKCITSKNKNYYRDFYKLIVSNKS